MAKKNKESKSSIEKTRENFEYVPREDAANAVDNLDESYDQLDAEARSGATNPTGLKLNEPSRLQNPYMSEEDQGMQLLPKIVGPPQYGSPDPATAASGLLTLEDGHPLDLLPEGHPAAISEDYAADLFGGGSDEEINATDSARELAEAESVDLRQVSGTGKDGKVTKEDVEKFVTTRDEDAS